ncbi:MAG TPA: DUF1415 family protein [Polyangiaceae bacterium]|nr:DUF1415 family protein [Polyangiaceae bacterium]
MTYLRDLTAATLRVYERYAVEVVERLGFCPWARGARESRQVRLHVISSTDRDDFDESLGLLSELCRTPSASDIALLIYPVLDLDRLGFEDYARRLRAVAEQASPPLDAYAMAAFHPAATADLSHPDRLVPYVRRSPDPMLQLLRNSALSGIKGLSQGTEFLDISELSADALRALREPPPKALRDRIAEQNLSTVRDVGQSAIDAVLADIASEREAAHEQLFARHGRRGPRRD